MDQNWICIFKAIQFISTTTMVRQTGLIKGGFVDILGDLILMNKLICNLILNNLDINRTFWKVSENFSLMQVKRESCSLFYITIFFFKSFFYKQ